MGFIFNITNSPEREQASDRDWKCYSFHINTTLRSLILNYKITLGKKENYRTIIRNEIDYHPKSIN